MTSDPTVLLQFLLLKICSLFYESFTFDFLDFYSISHVAARSRKSCIVHLELHKQMRLYIYTSTVQYPFKIFISYVIWHILTKCILLITHLVKIEKLGFYLQRLCPHLPCPSNNALTLNHFNWNSLIFFFFIECNWVHILSSLFIFAPKDIKTKYVEDSLDQTKNMKLSSKLFLFSFFCKIQRFSTYLLH